MNKPLKIQKQKLETALFYAEKIEKCDAAIEVGRHVNYYKSVRAECIEKYADAVAEIIENSIDIAVEFSKVEAFDQRLMAEINSINIVKQ